jgi:hypothetical protein
MWGSQFWLRTRSPAGPAGWKAGGGQDCPPHLSANSQQLSGSGCGKIGFNRSKVANLMDSAIAAAVVFFAASVAGMAADATFQNSVQPLFTNNCYTCHNAQLKSGDLNLQASTSAAALIQDREKAEAILHKLETGEIQADLIRTATFMIGREGSQRTYEEIGIPDPHHPLTHHRGNPVLGKLKSTPEGDGTLLDHSTYAKGTPVANLWLTLLDRMGVHPESVGDSTGRLDH